jgi:hypothetical protein
VWGVRADVWLDDCVVGCGIGGLAFIFVVWGEEWFETYRTFVFSVAIGWLQRRVEACEECTTRFSRGSARPVRDLVPGDRGGS